MVYFLGNGGNQWRQVCCSRKFIDSMYYEPFFEVVKWTSEHEKSQLSQFSKIQGNVGQDSHRDSSASSDGFLIQTFMNFNF